MTGHLPLVGHLARETAARLPRHLDTDDLVGAGALALVQAANSYDPTLGVPFARFAATRIRGAMIDQMRQRDWATRSIRSRARALAAVAEQLTSALNRTPTGAELAAASGLSEAEVRAVREGTDRACVLSLDPLTVDDEGLAANLEDCGVRPEEALVAAERMGYLRDAISELPERPRFVVIAYYLEHRPLTEIAEELKVTQSRVSQLRAEGLDLLRQALTELLDEGSRVGRAPAGQPEGVRARRREAYVTAVANRSGPRERADVQAYLSGACLPGTSRSSASLPEASPAGTSLPGASPAGTSLPDTPAGASLPDTPAGASLPDTPAGASLPDTPLPDAPLPDASSTGAPPPGTPLPDTTLGDTTLRDTTLQDAAPAPAGTAPQRRAAAAYTS